MLHKLNIVNSADYEMSETKDGSIVFTMTNSGREFFIATKPAINMDLKLIDRIVRAICVDTRLQT